jgi:hypothetical protein
VTNASPQFVLVENDQGADAKSWRHRINGGQYLFETVDDSISNPHAGIAIVRSGNSVASVSLGNATDNPTYSLLGAGPFAYGGPLIETGVISPTQLAANTDNWNPTGLASARVIRLSTDASRNLTGIVAQAAGTMVWLVNVGAQDCVLVHNATSTAANRFFCPGSANFTLNANDSVQIRYDTTSSRWRALAA